MKNKRLIIILLISSFIFLTPFIAMQYNVGVEWTTSDFIIAGGLIFGTGLIIEFVLRKISSLNQRVVMVAALLILIILVFIELAVGIFDSPLNGN